MGKIAMYWLGRLTGVALIFGMGCASAGAAPNGQPPTIGIAAHMWGLSPKDLDFQLDLISQGHFKVIRWDAPWQAVEPEKGKLHVPPNWDYLVKGAQSRGLDLMVVLDYGNQFYDNGDKPVSPAAVAGFSNYAAFLAAHFAGRIKYYEVWNEWNSKIGKTSRGRTSDYVALLRSTYSAIKGADPAAQVIAGGFSSSAYDDLVHYGKREDTFESLVSSGIGKFCDAVSIHPYVVYRDGPTRSLNGFDDLMTAVVGAIRRSPGLEQKPIIISEIGWPTAKDSPRGVSEQQQADYLSHALDVATRLGIAQFVVYELRDGNKDPGDPEGSFGVTRFNFSPKPAYDVFRNAK